MLYTNLRDYLLRYLPWMRLWILVSVLGVGGVVGLVLVYKFVLPSLWAFRSRQMDTRATINRTPIVIAVSGGFDPLNGLGHLTHIQEAKKLGGDQPVKLVAILSRDDQLERKGNKPSGTFYPSIIDRIAILKELRSVDEVVINIDKDLTCTETLRMVRPQILAKGGDRSPDQHPIPQSEIDVCKEIGCKIVYNVGIPKKTSSSELIRRAGATQRL